MSAIFILRNTKKKKDDEIEMLATRPTEALPPMPPLTEKQLRAGNNDRVQTCERALCGVLDRLDAIEARIQSHDNDITELLHEAVAPSGHREDHSEISDRLDVIEKEHTSVDPQGSGAVGREHETIRALIDTMDERVRSEERRVGKECRL